MKEKASRYNFMVQLLCNKKNIKDLEIINSRADYLKKEAGNVLAYQIIIGRKKNVEV